jgi:hypothetical protein
MTRDPALIALAGLIVLVAMVCATVLVVVGHADPVAGFGVITAGVGIGGVALGRLGGPPPQPEQKG